VTGFTDQQLTDLRAPLARENVKGREQAGRNVSYLEGWHVIAEANRIFGFDGWDRETVDCRCVVERERKIGRPPNERDGWQVGYIVKVRVLVRAGQVDEAYNTPVREGTGYGSGIDVDLGAAHESAIKEAETDGMKRALMTFGNQFGLALYDKTQAEVAPAQKPAPAPVQQRNAPGLSSAVTGVTGPAEHPKHPQAREAWKRIHDSLARADTLKRVEEIVAANGVGLAIVKEVSPATYDDLMRFANARKTEFYGATG
jgi:DNA recombination protein Rad52